jgi:hypothetical protein
MQQPSQPPARRSGRRLFVLTAVLVALGISGCANAPRMYGFRANAVSKISFDPKNCTELPDGKFKCKDVVFTVNSIVPIKAP